MLEDRLCLLPKCDRNASLLLLHIIDRAWHLSVEQHLCTRGCMFGACMCFVDGVCVRTPVHARVYVRACGYMQAGVRVCAYECMRIGPSVLGMQECSGDAGQPAHISLTDTYQGTGLLPVGAVGGEGVSWQHGASTSSLLFSPLQSTLQGINTIRSER